LSPFTADDQEASTGIPLEEQWQMAQVHTPARLPGRRLTRWLLQAEATLTQVEAGEGL
jgi:hypothetical protein